MTTLTATTYGLTAIKMAGGEETPRFEAGLTKDGKRVGTVANGGHGGCCDYHFPDRAERDRFQQWIKQFHPHRFEPDDAWVYKQLDKDREQKTFVRRAKTSVVFKTAEQCQSDDGAFTVLRGVTFRGWDSPAGLFIKQKIGAGAKVFDPTDRQWKDVP